MQCKGFSFCLSIIRVRYDLRYDLHHSISAVFPPTPLPYLALPFVRRELWLDKAGAIMRPGVDQLPGTCVDFYAVQNGLVFAGEDQSLLLVCQDAPLVTMGEMEAHPIRLMGEAVANGDPVYSWVMNNFWETNFNACLAGFYQFHYDLMLTGETEPAAAFGELTRLNQGVVQFYLFEGDRVIPNRV